MVVRALFTLASAVFGAVDDRLIPGERVGQDGACPAGISSRVVVWTEKRVHAAGAGLIYRPRADGMHALRHFYASTLLARGVSIKELAEYLGHNDAGFTLRTYTHLVPSSHERALQAVDAVLGEARDGLETA